MSIDLLPSGVRLVPFHTYQDDRGIFAEMYRKEWQLSEELLQWNIAYSKANVLRGVHLHCKHIDYLILIKGHMTLYLHDVRPDSLTKGKSFVVSLKESALQAVIIPTGVAHGFYFNEDSIHIYAVSEYWDHEDEMGCLWNSKELNMVWPTKNPNLSMRDKNACSYEEMIGEYLEKKERIKC